MPARNIVVVCSGSHEKKVNLGEVFQYWYRSQWEIRMPARNIVSSVAISREEVNLGEVFRVRSFGEVFRARNIVSSVAISREEGQPW